MMKKDGTFQEDIQCILPGPNSNSGAIYVSNIQAASNPNTLKKYNIEAVITAIKGKNLTDIIPRHMEYLYIPVVDHEACDISSFFKDSIEFIDSERRRTNVLVHCMAGVSRSITLIIAYLIQKMEMPYKQAFQFVKVKRRIIHPNDGFIKQLLQHQKKCLSKQNLQALKCINNCQDQQEGNKTMNSTTNTSWKAHQNLSIKDQQRIKVTQTWQKHHNNQVNADYNFDYDKKLKQKIGELFQRKKIAGTSSLANCNFSLFR